MISLLLILLSAQSRFSMAAIVTTCEDPGATPYKFVFKTVTQLIPQQQFSFSGRCFKKITTVLQGDSNFLNVTIEAYQKSSFFCAEGLFFTTGRNSDWQVLFLQGSYHLSFAKSQMTLNETLYVQQNGLFVMAGCSDFWEIPKSLFSTVKLFLGGLGTNPLIPIFGSKVPEYQLNANLEFLRTNAGFAFQKRPNPKFIKPDKSHIKSGDFLAITRFDGIDQLIHWGSGSHIGHSTMAMWRDGELYVIESQDGPYWPRHGIQKNTFDQWVIWADNADFNVVLIPLSDESRKKFDEAKAWAFFDSMEGHNYGYHNFLFGYWDTKSENNTPLMDLTFISQLAGLLEKVAPSLTIKMVYEALGKRLNTTILSKDSLWDMIYATKKSLEEIMAIPEDESWSYSDGHNYVCSSFLVAVYKAGGLFGDLPLNAPEFTPKDLSELRIWDVSGAKVPPECQGFAPRGYCQLMGKVDMDLGQINFVEPYAHMAERCPTMAPEYKRREGC